MDHTDQLLRIEVAQSHAESRGPDWAEPRFWLLRVVCFSFCAGVFVGFLLLVWGVLLLAGDATLVEAAVGAAIANRRQEHEF